MHGIIGVLTLLQPLIEGAVPALFPAWTSPLQGMQTRAPAVTLGLRPVLDGSFQSAAAAWVGDHIAQRSTIVRAYNEVLWRSFGTSYMANRSLVRGLGGTLFEQNYILAYCGIRSITDITSLPAFARRLRVTEDWFVQRHRRLVYYLAPVKTSWFPDRIPASFPCPAGKRDQVRSSVLTAFQKAGVDFVDGRAVLEAQRGQIPVELFPRNGIHWNWLGTAIGTNALLLKLRELGLTTLPLLRYNVTATSQEEGSDRDLSDLLNLIWPPPSDLAPRVAVTPAEPAGTLRLAAVNDSFFEYLPITLLDAGRIFRSETVFGYLTLDQRHYESGEMVPIKKNAAGIMQTLLDADVVVLEEVESRVGGPYALQFLDMVEEEMMGRRTAGQIVR